MINHALAHCMIRACAPAIHSRICTCQRFDNRLACVNWTEAHCAHRIEKLGFVGLREQDLMHIKPKVWCRSSAIRIHTCQTGAPSLHVLWSADLPIMLQKIVWTTWLALTNNSLKTLALAISLTCNFQTGNQS